MVNLFSGGRPLLMACVFVSSLACGPGLLVAGLAVASRPAVAQSAQRIAAVVNNEVVTSQDLAERIQLVIGTAGLPDDAETRRRLAPQVLRGLIDEKLQLQEAARLRIDVRDAEVERAFASVAERNRLSPEQLTQALRGRSIAPAVVKQQLRAQVAWIKVVGRELRSRVAVSAQQIDQALKGGQAGEAELRLLEILLPVYSAGQETQVIKEAAELVDTLRRGADFANLARQISAAQSAGAGGDLGWIKLGALVPEIRNAVANLAVGAVSAPVRTPAGVHIFRVAERRTAGPGSAASEEERAQVQRRLEDEQLQRLASRYLRDLRRNAYIDVRL